MTTRILFVCLGNICRSPAAEAVFRSLGADLDVALDSAGTGGWHVGEPPYGPMQQAARLRGIEMGTLRARQFEPLDFAGFDLILAMDAQNLADIKAMRGASEAKHETKVALFTDYCVQLRADCVPDPYYTRDFDGALDIIEDASRGLAQALRVQG